MHWTHLLFMMQDFALDSAKVLVLYIYIYIVAISCVRILHSSTVITSKYKCQEVHIDLETTVQ